MMIKELGNVELHARMMAACAHARLAMADLLERLAEVDARKLYLEYAFPHLHAYCMGALHFSEHQAYERITAARLSRRFPSVLSMLREGSMHLSGLGVLAPCLTEENAGELLSKARFQSK